MAPQCVMVTTLTSRQMVGIRPNVGIKRSKRYVTVTLRLQYESTIVDISIYSRLHHFVSF